MSEIMVSMSGLGSYSVDLSLSDPGINNDTTEVWRAIFTDKQDNSNWEVYFEMNPEYEVWDLVNEAIYAYRETVDELEY